MSIFTHALCKSMDITKTCSKKKKQGVFINNKKVAETCKQAMREEACAQTYI